MKPFLLLQVRPEDIAARDEYVGFLETMSLSDKYLVNMRVHDGNFTSINLDLFSGVILGGGPPNISDESDNKTPAQVKMEENLMKLMNEIIEEDIPFLGVCYGHGILAIHQGVEITKKYSEEFGSTNIELTQQGIEDDLCLGIEPNFDAYVGHKESVETLPNTAVLLGKSESCPVQFFKIKNNIYGVQFHPELDKKSLRLRAEVYKDSGYFPSNEVEDIIDKIEKSNVSQPKIILKNFAEKYAKHSL